MHSLRTTTGDELLNVIDAFASADLDSDGKLSSAEFHSWYTRSLRRHGHSLSDPDLIYKLRRVDAAVADGSGQRVVWTERAAAPEGATESRLEWHAASPSAAAARDAAEPPTTAQLRKLGLGAAIPFVAFGSLGRAACQTQARRDITHMRM